MLNMELSHLKGKSNVQPSQNNSDNMMNKLEKGSSITYSKLPLTDLMKSHHKSNKYKIKKKAHVKCFECSKMGHFASECPNKKEDQTKLSRR
jgi:paraquat-inducible protein B